MANRPLRLFTTNNLSGVYLNAAAVIVARDIGHARRVLMKSLEEQNLPQDTPESIKIEPLDITEPVCRVIWDGNY